MQRSNYNSKKSKNKWHEKCISKYIMVHLILSEVVLRKGKWIRRVNMFPKDRYEARGLEKELEMMKS